MSAVPVTVTPPALELDDLQVAFDVRGRWLRVLRGVSLTIAAGGSYGLVGESGCGKSTTALAIMRYLPRNGRVIGGSIRVGGADLAGHVRRGGAPLPLPDGVDGLPEPWSGPEPVNSGRRPGSRGFHDRRRSTR